MKICRVCYSLLVTICDLDPKTDLQNPSVLIAYRDRNINEIGYYLCSDLNAQLLLIGQTLYFTRENPRYAPVGLGIAVVLLSGIKSLPYQQQSGIYDLGPNRGSISFYLFTKESSKTFKISLTLGLNFFKTTLDFENLVFNLVRLQVYATTQIKGFINLKNRLFAIFVTSF